MPLIVIQSLFTLMMYVLGVLILGVAGYPSVYLIYSIWIKAAPLAPREKLFCVSLGAALGYFIFGLVLICVVSIVRVLLNLKLKEGEYRLSSVMILKWMMLNALILAVRSTFMDFILLTPVVSLFYRLMGARLGKGVQINSKNVADIPLLEIGDRSVIGGNATVIGHIFEKKGLVLKKVKIGKNVIIGLNSVIMPGVEIGDNAVIAAAAVVPKDMRIEANTVYYGVKKE